MTGRPFLALVALLTLACSATSAPDRAEPGDVGLLSPGVDTQAPSEDLRSGWVDVKPRPADEATEAGEPETPARAA